MNARSAAAAGQTPTPETSPGQGTAETPPTRAQGTQAQTRASSREPDATERAMLDELKAIREEAKPIRERVAAMTEERTELQTRAQELQDSARVIQRWLKDRGWTERTIAPHLI